MRSYCAFWQLLAQQAAQGFGSLADREPCRLGRIRSRNSAVQAWFLGGLLLLLGASPAIAHHPFGGTTPDSAVEGFLSGLGHPVTGPDHAVFVVAIGLLGLAHARGWVLPVAFVFGTLIGTAGHLAGADLPALETLISASVVGLGALLAAGRRWSLVGLILVGAIAGLFHGYAYGEAIVGAEMTPLVAYLLGFTTVQLALALAVYGLGRKLLGEALDLPSLPLQFAGFAILGAGTAFLSGVVLG